MEPIFVDVFSAVGRRSAGCRGLAMLRSKIVSRVLLAALSISVALPATALASTPTALTLPTRQAIARESRLAPAMVAGTASQSSNWAGYAVTAGRYASVTGQWTVPEVGAMPGLSASALWIGIDGVSDQHLIQTGTEQDSVNGRTEYNAWWEILPAAAVPITAFSVRPGDRMSAKIAQVSTGRWRITISDARSGSFSTTRAYGGTGSSAEWILEAPFLGRWQAQLAQLSSTGFDRTTVNGANPRLDRADEITLVQGDTTVATPSTPDTDHDGFSFA